MKIRRATDADLDTVVATLVESHMDYVWEVWAITGSGRRAKLTELVRHHVELIALPRREVWMSHDGAAVAIWRSEPEESVDTHANTRLAEVGRSVFGSRLALIEEVDARVLAHRPTEPHRFLGTMGVLPHRQRQGLGSAVLQPVLDELDRTGIPACLETSALGNLEFYGRLGFTVVAHLDDLPAGAPETWVLWRPPASG
jgi:predicted N-acetyltransferase YhbS